MRKTRMISGLSALCTALSCICVSVRIHADAAQTAVTQSSAAELSVSELRKRTCQDYGFRDLEGQENAANKQRFYGLLTDTMEKFWDNEKDADTLKNVKIGTFWYCGIATLEDYGLTFEEASQVYETFRNDNPLFYFASNEFYGFPQSDTLTYIVFPCYPEFAEGALRQQIQKESLPALIDSYADCAAKGTLCEKAKAIHDKLIANMSYKYQSDGVTPDESGYSHGIAGAAAGEGVCEAYAKTYQLLCNYYGIPNLYVVGHVNREHSWNLVQLDDEMYYHVDVTADDQTNPSGNTFFGVGADRIQKTHKIFTPADKGCEYLYALPENISASDYQAKPQAASGDLNGDGQCSVADCVVLQIRLTGGSGQMSAWQNADVYADGRLDARDLTCMKRILTAAVS